jgi:hypothetical protein
MNTINNSEPPRVNRGVELLLRKRREKDEEPKKDDFWFSNRFSLLKREFTVQIGIRKIDKE